MAGQPRVSEDVYSKVGSFLANFGEAMYQVPIKECDRLAGIYSTELNRTIPSKEILHAVRKFKKEMKIPVVRGGNFRAKIINGQLVTKQVSGRYKPRTDRLAIATPSDGQQQQQETVKIPKELKPLTNVIRRLVREETKRLREEILSVKQENKKIREENASLRERLKEANEDAKSAAEQYKQLSITYETRMHELRHLDEVICACEKFLAFKRSATKKKTDAIL